MMTKFRVETKGSQLHLSKFDITDKLVWSKNVADFWTAEDARDGKKAVEKSLGLCGFLVDKEHHAG